MQISMCREKNDNYFPSLMILWCLTQRQQFTVRSSPCGEFTFSSFNVFVFIRMLILSSHSYWMCSSPKDAINVCNAQGWRWIHPVSVVIRTTLICYTVRVSGRRDEAVICNNSSIFFPLSLFFGSRKLLFKHGITCRRYTGVKLFK